eukprot:10774522-Alexandrium_andersonii.AAC.1
MGHEQAKGRRRSSEGWHRPAGRRTQGRLAQGGPGAQNKRALQQNLEDAEKLEQFPSVASLKRGVAEAMATL